MARPGAALSATLRSARGHRGVRTACCTPAPPAPLPAVSPSPPAPRARPQRAAADRQGRAMGVPWACLALCACVARLSLGFRLAGLSGCAIYKIVRCGQAAAKPGMIPDDSRPYENPSLIPPVSPPEGGSFSRLPCCAPSPARRGSRQAPTSQPRQRC